MFWTRSRIEKLQNRAQEALGRVGTLFQEGVLSPAANQSAWGQYLKESHNNTQFGIYGTSAGIQVLLFAGYGDLFPLVEKARCCLKQAVDSPTHRFAEKNDTFIIYKVVYLVEALIEQDNGTSESHWAVQRLLDSVLPSSGWGQFYISNDERDWRPQETATASALLSLRHCGFWRSQPSCRDAVKWLCKRVRENSTLQTYEFALAALALSYYQDIQQFPDAANALSICVQSLQRRIAHRGYRTAHEIEIHNYSAPRRIGGIQENQYLFFVPDAMAALALLRTLPQYRTPRSLKYILNIVQFYCDQVLEGEFVAKETGKASTVDHLWLCKLFHEFRDKRTDDMVPSWWFRWRTVPLMLRIIGSIMLLILGGAGFVYQENGASLWLKVFGFIVAAVGVGLFVTMFWESVKGQA